MKVIFLDVDGVLNYIGASVHVQGGMYFVEDDKLRLLQKLVFDTGAELVLSSSWRNGWTTPEAGTTHLSKPEEAQLYFMLCAKLHDFNLSLLSELPMQPHCSREDTINYWLANWPGEAIENYVILDDQEKFFSTDNRHLVLTSALTGITPDNVEKAKAILNISKPRIIVVDDREVNRAVLKENLKDEYDVIEADSGSVTLRILQRDRSIAMVITDIQMPNMNGLELISKIRSNRNYDRIVIIANTQYGDPAQEEEIIDRGADDFIYKPTTPRIIKLRVRNAFRLGCSAAPL